MFEHNLDNLSVKQLSDMGYSFLCNHEYEKAIICFKKVADLDTTYEYVYSNIGECQINLGLYKEAMESFWRQYEVHPNLSGDFYATWGGLCLKLGLIDGAINILEKGIYLENGLHFARDNGSLLFALGLAYCKSKNYEKAVITLRRAIVGADLYLFEKLGLIDNILQLLKDLIQNKPDIVEARFILSWTYLELERDREALDVLKNAVYDFPDYNEARFILGCVYMTLEKYRDASAIFEEIISVRSNDSGIKFSIGWAYLKLGCIHEAMRAFSDLVWNYPITNHNILNNWAFKYSRFHIADDFLYEIKDLIRVNPDDFSSHCLLGWIYLNQYHDRYNAVRALKKTIRINPEYAPAYCILGYTYFRDNVDVALKNFKKAVQLKFDFMRAYDGLGLAYLNLSKKEDGITTFQNALAIKPDDAQLNVLLGEIYLSNNNYQKAFEYCKRAIQIDSDYSSTYHLIGNINFAAGYYNEAIKAYKLAISKGSNSEFVYTNLAESYIKIGLPQKAIEAYSEAILYAQDLLLQLDIPKRINTLLNSSDAPKIRINKKLIFPDLRS